MKPQEFYKFNILKYLILLYLVDRFLKRNLSNSVIFSFLVSPESPVVLDRWGRQLNSTMIGPMQEGEDIILSCRVVGGKNFSKSNFAILF